MTDKEIKNKYSAVRKYLEGNRLNAAMSTLRNLADGSGDHRTLDALRNIEATYGYLSQYLAEGMADSSRLSVFEGLKESLFSITDSLERNELEAESSDLYFSTLRIQRLSSGNLQSLIDNYMSAFAETDLQIMASGNAPYTALRNRDEILDRIFTYIWTSHILTSSESETISKVLSSPDSPFALSSQIISALFMSMVQYYDSQKLLIIARALPSTDNEVLKRRLCIVLFLLLTIYSKRAASNKEVKNIIDSLAEDASFREYVKSILLAILTALDTQRINDKMIHEFIPDLQRLQEEFKKRFKSDFTPDAEMLGMEINPEWEDMISDSGLMDKMRELQDLQTDGADVLMLAFSNLKQFPFFRLPGNWFLPFDASHHLLSGDNTLIDGIVRPFAEAGQGICSSDLYSMAFSIGRMPEAQRSMISGQMRNEIEKLEEMHRHQEIGSNEDSQRGITDYIRDLYRFFKLHPRRNEFKDPFSVIPDIARIPFIGNILKDRETYASAANFYFKTGDYAQALVYLKELLPLTDQRIQILQKAGYASQAIRDYKGALEYYLEASDDAPDNLWLTKKIAVCHRNLSNNEEAARWYRRALDMDSDNLVLNLNYANTLFDLNKIDEALKIYYKVDFLDENGEKAWRPIAWCEFLSGNFTKSRTFYEKIIFSRPTSADYMNFGHLCLCERHIREAIGYYSESYRVSKKSEDDWRESFQSDRNLLAPSGLTYIELDILLDRIFSQENR